MKTNGFVVVHQLLTGQNLTLSDLIKRNRGKYVLTPFVEVIYMVQLGFSEAVDEHLK